jgi:hypothetical protein
MRYQQEEFAPFLEEGSECQALIKAHWGAVALDQGTIPLDPDWDLYRHMNAKGIVHLTTARQAGDLVGYAVYLLSTALHYKHLSIAEADVFWLGPAYRKGLTGVRMMRCAEDSLRGIGVHKIFTKIKLHYDVGKVFEYMGHVPIERVYAKGLS